MRSVWRQCGRPGGQKCLPVTYCRVAADLERGRGLWVEGDFLPAAIKAVLGEMGRTNRRPEPRMPVRAADGLHPLSQQGLVVKRKPTGRSDVRVRRARRADALQSPTTRHMMHKLRVITLRAV